MSPRLDTRRILIFLTFAFGIAWAAALAIYLTGGLADSPMLEGFQGTSVSLAAVLMALPMMWAPAIAHILTRLITREGWKDHGLSPHLNRRTWIYLLLAWLGIPLLFILSAALTFVLRPASFGPSGQGLSAQMVPDELRGMAWIGVLGLVNAPLINVFSTFGEEFGWRGYLQQKLMPLGGRAAMVLMGLIWGVWHVPVLLMGYSYGLDFPGVPWAGVLAFIWFTFLMGTILGWLALKGRSVWPAVLGHAMINGFAGLAVMFFQMEPNLVHGPLPFGLLGSIPSALVVAWMLLNPKALTPAEHQGAVPDEPGLVTRPA